MVNMPNLFQVQPGQTTAREADGTWRSPEARGSGEAQEAGGAAAAGGGDQLTLSPEAQALGGVLGGSPEELSAAHGGLAGLLDGDDREALNGIVAEFSENTDAGPEEIAEAALWLQEQAVQARFLDAEGAEGPVLTGELSQRLADDEAAAGRAPEGLVAAMTAYFGEEAESEQA